MVRAAGETLRRVADGIRADYERFRVRVEALRRSPGVEAGLYAYRIENEQGKLRLHLRIHDDRTGLLFINAVETLHLSPTDAEMAKLALDGACFEEATARLEVFYPEVAKRELAARFTHMAEALERVKRSSDGCRACELGLAQPPPFSVRPHAPYKADLALHYACNNNCSHCYNEPGRRTMPSMPTEDWQRVLRRLYELGVPYIIFTGGEPTLHPDLEELVAYAEDLGQITGVNTNGRRLSDPDFTAELAAAGADHVQITLASHRRELHDRIVRAEAFDETVAGIRCALETGLHTLTNTTLIRDNADEATDIVDFLHGLGVRTFAMNGMIHSGCGARHPAALSTDEVAPVLERVLARAGELGMRFLWYTPTEYCRFSPIEAGLGIHSCNAAEYSMCVEPNGDVLPCQSYYEAAGNILADPWESIWDSDLFRRLRYRREHPGEAGLPQKCWDCEQLPLCGGGCPLE